MAIELPRIETPKIDPGALTRDLELPKVELPKVDLSSLETPRIDVTAIGRRLGIVSEPQPVVRARTASLMGIVVLAALSFGVAMWYFFDPAQGQARRDRLIQKFRGLTGSAEGSVERLEDTVSSTSESVSEAAQEAWSDASGDGETPFDPGHEVRAPELTPSQG